MHIVDLTRFLAELKENNNRAWFVMNKPRYDILRAEFLEFVSELIKGISKFDPAMVQCDPKKAMFRINRDVRFRVDKSPYKTNFSAALIPTGRKKPSEGGGPVYYFQLDGDGRLFFAVGEYMPPADRLKAIRGQIIDDPAGFSKLIKNKKLKETFGQLDEEGKLVRPPKGYDPEHIHIEYLKLKSMMMWTEQPLNGMLHAEVMQTLQSGFKAAYPLISWLRASI
jgi:uncharacterized protein (TIGR02453 family)